MPIEAREFDSLGRKPQKKKIQERILMVLRENPKTAFSSKELEEICETRRESINQSLRALEAKGKIVRGTIYDKQTRRNVMYAKSKEE